MGADVAEHGRPAKPRVHPAGAVCGERLARAAAWTRTRRVRGPTRGGSQATRPGYPWHFAPGAISAGVAFWTPLLDNNVNQESRKRYEKATREFMAFVREHGDRVEDAGDLDYWFAYYAHTAYMAGRPSRSDLEKALADVEHWLPELKPLPLSRRCMRGWHRLVPPVPAAPMPRDLAFALAATAALAGSWRLLSQCSFRLTAGSASRSHC